MLMLWPLEIWSKIAGNPSFVAGIFTMTFGRLQRSRRSSAIRIVPRVLLARVGATSMLTKPSRPLRLARFRRGRDDALGGDPGGVHQLRGLAGLGQAFHGEMHEP